MRRTRNGSAALALLFASALTAAATAQGDADRDGDGLSDFAERHKYRTDPARADSDGDGVPDGDWRERREYQYTVSSVVHNRVDVSLARLRSLGLRDHVVRRGGRVVLHGALRRGSERPPEGGG